MFFSFRLVIHIFWIVYYAVVMHKEKEENGLLSHIHHHDAYRSRELHTFEHSLSDGDMFLQVSILIFAFFNFTY